MRKETTKSLVKATTDVRTEGTQTADMASRKIQNQGSSTQKYNTAHDNKHNTYRFSNQGMVDAVTRQNTVGETTSRYFQSKVVPGQGQWMGQQMRYTISEPIFKDSPNKTSVVTFVYNAYANQTAKTSQEGRAVNNNTTTARMIHNTEHGSESTNATTSRHFGKKVEVEPIITKYDYFSSEIFSENTSVNINRFGTFKKGYTRITNNNVNATATPQAKTTQTSNKTQREQIGQVRANNVTNARSAGAQVTPGEFTHKGNVVWNTTNSKYTIGYSFEFAGKTPKAVSTARTTKDIRFSGTTKCNTADNASVPFNTNSRISNIATAQKSNINKNGKFNVRIKTGHT
uniref:Small ribosomal subunit protein uS3m n=1 Tax=Magnusiomyces tetraspermus TaxID=1232584 RepID=A0A023UP47_9ASCO|nr:ribosomal protein S3 [Magnusiomyces tetraspermus]AHY04926.1 ribosomal protein S3 [Magnusiomyces tetraspermus]